MCGCCTLRGYCSERTKPIADVDEVGETYVKIMSDILGVSPLLMSRKKDLVWGRNAIAYQLCQDGFSQKEIASVVHKNRVTVVHCIQMMELALRNPRQYYSEMKIWNKFQEKLSLGINT